MVQLLHPSAGRGPNVFSKIAILVKTTNFQIAIALRRYKIELYLYSEFYRELKGLSFEEFFENGRHIGFCRHLVFNI